MTDTVISTLAPSCDGYDPEALSVDEARQRILDAITPLGITDAESLPLFQVLDCVLAEDIISTMNVPPHNNSAMDGYALHARELPGANDMCRLRVVGSSFAGHPFTGQCGRGECISIMTGAIVPNGLDTVIPLEHVQSIAPNTISIDSRTRQGENVRSCGEDISQGQIILARGKRISPADLGLIASIGITQVSVLRRLRVAYFSTGDELRPPGEALQPGEIYDSNRYTLYGMLTHQYCQVTDMGIVRDDPSALREALKTAASNHDVVITSGGVSVGEADYVRKVFSELGDIAFWKVSMKPGRPLTFGKMDNTLFFGLPGNPVSVMVSFYQFVCPALRRLSGELATPPLTMPAISTSRLKKRPGRTEFQRGILSQAEDGRLIVCKTGAQGSGVLTSMSHANCFIVLSAEQTQVEPGDVVLVQPFAGWL